LGVTNVRPTLLMVQSGVGGKDLALADLIRDFDSLHLPRFFPSQGQYAADSTGNIIVLVFRPKTSARTLTRAVRGRYLLYP
jgi:hypothetical protein